MAKSSHKTSTETGEGHPVSQAPGLPCASEPAKPDQEIELKLLASKATLKRIATSKLVRKAAIGPFKVRQLETRYFDTPEYTLRSKGLTLRLRHWAGRWKQTLKTHVEDAECLFHRMEWSKDVDGPVLDLDAIPPQAWPGGQCCVTSDDLTYLFHTEITRTRVHLKWPDKNDELATIELCLDKGKVVAGDKHESISEVELELVSGPQGALFALEKRLQKDFDVECATCSKSDRGFELLQPEGAPKAA